MTEPKISLKGSIMTIEVDLNTTGEVSASGKSMVISSTHGNKSYLTEAGEITVGLNVYTKVKATA